MIFHSYGTVYQRVSFVLVFSHLGLSEQGILLEAGWPWVFRASSEPASVAQELAICYQHSYLETPCSETPS